MIISKDFPGGNIEVISMTENEVIVERELRDTSGDWFYWAFCVEDACPRGAESHTIRFSFAGKPRVAKFGAAVSHDLNHWSWTNTREGEGFSYTFKPAEKVYFAFCFIYSDEMLRKFAKEFDRDGYRNAFMRDLPHKYHEENLFCTFGFTRCRGVMYRKRTNCGY